MATVTWKNAKDFSNGKALRGYADSSSATITIQPTEINLSVSLDEGANGKRMNVPIVIADVVGLQAMLETAVKAAIEA